MIVILQQKRINKMDMKKKKCTHGHIIIINNESKQNIWVIFCFLFVVIYNWGFLCIFRWIQHIKVKKQWFIFWKCLKYHMNDT